MLAAIEAASEALDEYLSWSLRPKTTSLTVWTNSNRFLLLPAPIRSMSVCEEVLSDQSVARDMTSEVRLAPEQITAVDGSNNRLFSALEAVDRFPEFPNGLRITGSWGCQTYPKLVQYAAMATAFNIWRSLRRDEAQETSTSTVGLTTHFSLEELGPKYSLIPKQYQMSLRAFRRPQL